MIFRLEIFHQHQQTSPSYGKRLDFEYASEQQRMLCWREKVICDRCQYISQIYVLLSPIFSPTLAVAVFLPGFPVFISSYRLYNLYDEIKTGKPGRKPATANVGLHIGLSNTPIGPSNVRKICLSSNIPAPSRRGLQKCANAVCKSIENVNTSDMKAKRKALKTINLLRGQPGTEIGGQDFGFRVYQFLVIILLNFGRLEYLNITLKSERAYSSTE